MLNTRGKIVLSTLLTVMIVLITGMVGIDEKKAVIENDSNIGNSLEMLSFSSESVAAFADSTLGQSIIKREIEKSEVIRKKEVAKQNKIDQQENTIYLTFDDGPSNRADQLLDILDNYQMKATFFMLGPKIKENTEVVKRMHKAGYGLALHGITHDVGKIYSNQSSPSNEMIENQRILENITGIRSYIVRLPYGSIPYLTEGMRYVLDQNDFMVWDWNVDSRDWEFNDGRYVQYTIWEIQKKDQAGITPVVLLHDNPRTIKYLPELLSYIKRQGYKTKVMTNDLPPLTFQCEGRCHPISGLTVGR